MVSRLVGAWAVLAMGALLVSAVPSPVAHAKIYTCSNGSGCSIWWDTSVWSGPSGGYAGNTYVGNTLEFDINIYGTYAQTDTITSVSVVTPWGTYSDSTLPQSLCYGCNYFWYVDFVVPATATPGNYTLNYTFAGTYASGNAFCVSTGSVCSGSISVNLKANPNTLQAQVASLQSTITTLNSNITSLKSQIASLQTQSASLQAQLTTAKTNITTLQASLATTNAQLATSKANLATAQSQLSTAQSQLAATQASLASTQSSLSTVSNLYLPVGVAVPGVVATLLLILYLRKKPASPPL